MPNAHEVRAALASASALGSDAVVLDGRMLDGALAVNVRRALEKAAL